MASSDAGASGPAPEVILAQKLASNEPKQRDLAVKKLSKWLRLRSQTKPFDLDEMLRVWKGLFYCVWMSDKPLVQEQLAERVAALAHTALKASPESALTFVEAGLVTLNREWLGLDTHRVDKFMMFARRLWRHALMAAKAGAWADEQGGVAAALVDVVERVVLRKGLKKGACLGFQMHMVDIYLEEVAKVGGEDWDGSVVMDFVRPFIGWFARKGGVAKEERLANHIEERVFQHLMRQSEVGVAYEMDDDDEEEEEGDDEVKEESEEAEADSEEEEMEAEVMEQDPRAGSVDVYLPHLPLDYEQITQELAEAAEDKDADMQRGSRSRLRKLAKQFGQLESGRYPLAAELSEDEDDEQMEKEAAAIAATKKMAKSKTREMMKEIEEKRQERLEYRKEMKKKGKNVSGGAEGEKKASDEDSGLEESAEESGEEEEEEVEEEEVEGEENEEEEEEMEEEEAEVDGEEESGEEEEEVDGEVEEEESGEVEEEESGEEEVDGEVEEEESGEEEEEMEEEEEPVKQKAKKGKKRKMAAEEVAEPPKKKKQEPVSQKSKSGKKTQEKAAAVEEKPLTKKEKKRLKQKLAREAEKTKADTSSPVPATTEAEPLRPLAKTSPKKSPDQTQQQKESPGLSKSQLKKAKKQQQQKEWEERMTKVTSTKAKKGKKEQSADPIVSTPTLNITTGEKKKSPKSGKKSPKNDALSDDEILPTKGLSGYSPPKIQATSPKNLPQPIFVRKALSKSGGQSAKGKASQSAPSTPENPIPKKTASKSVLVGKAKKMAAALKDGSQSESKAAKRKRINIELSRNKAQSLFEHDLSITESPEIPFEPAKRPKRGVLRIKEDISVVKTPESSPAASALNQRRAVMKNTQLNGKSKAMKVLGRMRASDFF